MNDSGMSDFLQSCKESASRSSNEHVHFLSCSVTFLLGDRFVEATFSSSFHFFPLNIIRAGM